MLRLDKRVPVMCLSFVLAASLTIAGCGKQEAPVKVPTPEEIVASSVLASAQASSAKYDIDMAFSMDIAGGPMAGQVNITTKGLSITDNAKKEIQTTVNRTLSTPRKQMETVMGVYLVEGWMYIKLGSPGVPATWTKRKTTEDPIQLRTVSRQLELFEKATQVSMAGSENVNGVPSYVIKVVPDINAMHRWLTLQQMLIQDGMDVSKADFARTAKEISARVWIAKGSYLPAKMELNVLVETDVADLEVPSNISDNNALMMKINALMTFHDYNQPVSIVLPAEAANARDISAQR